jgi:glycosyltransferase involved in cell wall biosynthesis
MAGERPKRLLFCSYHCCLDPSSGAALATRDLLELLAGHGWECQVLCGPQLDFEAGESLPQLLSDQQLPFVTRSWNTGPVPFTLFRYRQGQVAVTIYAPAAPERRLPTRPEGYAYLAILEHLLEQYQPQVLLTYGGDWLAQQIIASARERRVRVVFALHNFAYQDAAWFHSVDAVLVPSRFAQEFYREKLGLACTAIPSPMNWERVRCQEVQGQYVTFVNPQPHKGVFLFARLAQELWQRRPDIPLLVVESRARADWLARTGLDLSGLRNLHVMANTPDPRDFYGVSRIVLMPSLWNESFGRVAAEALINGIPVLASRRGALPEVLERAGFLFDVPACSTDESRVVPTAEEVTPWVEMILRLWDEVAFYRDQQRRCRDAAEAWRPERLGPLYDAFFSATARSSCE